MKMDKEKIIDWALIVAGARLGEYTKDENDRENGFTASNKMFTLRRLSAARVPFRLGQLSLRSSFPRLHSTTFPAARLAAGNVVNNGTLDETGQFCLKYPIKISLKKPIKQCIIINSDGECLGWE
jgi:hypothetical protein